MRVDRRALILRAYRRTASLAKAAAAAGCSQSYAWQVVNAAGAIQSPTPVYGLELVDEAERLYVGERLSCRVVAARLRDRHDPAPSQQTVYWWMKARGVLRTKSAADVLQNARRHGRDYDGEVGPRARELAGRRLSVRRIALELGVSRQAVKRHLDPQDRCGPAEATRRETWQADTPEAEARRQKRSRVIDMRRLEGATYAEIEAATGLSWATIYLYLRDAGLVAAEDYPDELRGLIRQLTGLRRLIRARVGDRP